MISPPNGVIFLEHVILDAPSKARTAPRILRVHGVLASQQVMAAPATVLQ